MKRTYYLLSVMFIILSLFTVVSAQNNPLVIPSEVKAMDTPNDSADGYTVYWSVSPSEGEGVYYLVSTSSSPEGPFTPLTKLDSRLNLASENKATFGFSSKNEELHYIEITVPKDESNQPLTWYTQIAISNDSEVIPLGGPVTANVVSNWFKFNKINNLVITLFLFLTIYYFIQRAHKDPNLFIRRIPGLEAIEEAVGRATEMGKPLLYITGAYDIDAVSTIASVNILSHVSKKVASYDSRIIVPCRFAIAMTVCQEVVKEAYLNIGRPDAFNVHDIFYVTSDQFGYTAAVDGLMVREKPAANFFLGTFAAESIILSETGASTGAIQIAGTDSTYQLPFFIVSCDYTLIGEELYAASAYLSREPKLLGSLRGQDIGKIMMVLVILLACLLLTLHNYFDFEWLLFLKNFMTAI